MNERLLELLGDEAETLLNHRPVVSRDKLHLPGPDYVDPTSPVNPATPAP